MRFAWLSSLFTLIFLSLNLASAQVPSKDSAPGPNTIALPRSPKAIARVGVAPTRLFPNGTTSLGTIGAAQTTSVIGTTPLVPIAPTRAPVVVAPTTISSVTSPTTISSVNSPTAISPFLGQPVAPAPQAATAPMPSFAPMPPAPSFAQSAPAPAVTQTNNFIDSSSGAPNVSQAPAAQSSVDLRAGTSQVTGPQSSGPNSVQTPRCFPEGSQYDNWKIGAVYLHGWHDPTDAAPDKSGFNQLESNNRAALMQYALQNHIKIALPVSNRTLSSNGFRTWQGVSEGDIESAAVVACGGAGFAEKKMLIGFSDGGYKARQLACSSSFFNSVYAIGSPPTANTPACNSSNLTQINPHVFPPQGAAGASFQQNLASYANSDNSDTPSTATGARAAAVR
jgi:hypothetical protein